MREATSDEIQNWDSLVLQNPDGGEVLQTRTWGQFKGRHGWKPRYFIYEIDGIQIAVLYLTRKVKGFGQVWYCPKGPGVTNAQQLLEIAKITRSGLVGSLSPFVVKFEPEVAESEEVLAALSGPGCGLRKSPQDVHISRATIRVGLAPSSDEILAKFKPKTRYNIRLAEKGGVSAQAVECNDENIKIMYGLMRATQKRAGFYLRAFDYYADYWKAQAKAGQGQLFFASYQGEILTGAYVTFFGTKAWYKDGGSTTQHRELMPAHLLQWEIIKWLKDKGVMVYDLVGIAPDITGGDPVAHAFAGITHFKSGFGGQAVQFIGTWDLPLDETKYALWNKAGERVTLAYHNRIKKSLWY